MCFEHINNFCAVTVNQVSDIFESRSTDFEAHFKRRTFCAESNANEEKQERTHPLLGKANIHKIYFTLYGRTVR